MKTIRYASLTLCVALAAGIVCGFVSRGVPESLFTVCTILSLLPVERESPPVSFIWSVSAAAALAASSFFRLGPFIVGSLAIAAFAIFSTARRYSSSHGLFLYDSALHAMEHHVRNIHLVILLSYSQFCCLFRNSALALCIFGAGLSGMLVAQIYRAVNGRIMVFSGKVETVVRETGRCKLRPSSSSAQTEEEDLRSRKLFERIEAYVNTEKAYLDRGFGLPQMAQAVGTNQNYVSRAVQLHTQLSFPQYMNRKKLEHAMSLLETMPMLRMAEVAERSGFGTSTSMNDVFKLFLSTTPGAYQAECLSTKKAEELRSRRMIF